MNKEKLTETLTIFYNNLEEKHKIILVGGASLLLQDMITETSDIDLITKEKETFDYVKKLIKEEDITSRTTEHCLYKSIGFYFSGQKFNLSDEIFAERFNFNDINTVKECELNGITIHIRTVELIKKDYEIAIARLESMNKKPTFFSSLLSRRLNRYQERLKLLKDY